MARVTELPQRDTARVAIKAITARGHELHLVPQNLMELWVVATRPVSQNGLDLSIMEATSELMRRFRSGRRVTAYAQCFDRTFPHAHGSHVATLVCPASPVAGPLPKHTVERPQTLPRGLCARQHERPGGHGRSFA